MASLPPGERCRGQLRAWSSFRPQVAADDMKAMFGGQECRPGDKKHITMQYEIHDGATSQLVEDSVEVSVAVYDRSKYKWLFMDFKLLADYWTGGIYKTSPNTCVLVLHEKGPRPFGLPYPRRRACDADVSSKDLDYLRERGWAFPKTVDMTLMVDGNEEPTPPVQVQLQLVDGKLVAHGLQRLSTDKWDLRDLYDCGYRVVSERHLLKMASTQPAPPYPDPDELAGPYYQPIAEPAVVPNSEGLSALTSSMSEPIMSSERLGARVSGTTRGAGRQVGARNQALLTARISGGVGGTSTSTAGRLTATISTPLRVDGGLGGSSQSLHTAGTAPGASGTEAGEGGGSAAVPSQDSAPGVGSAAPPPGSHRSALQDVAQMLLSREAEQLSRQLPSEPAPVLLPLERPPLGAMPSPMLLFGGGSGPMPSTTSTAGLPLTTLQPAGLSTCGTMDTGTGSLAQGDQLVRSASERPGYAPGFTHSGENEQYAGGGPPQWQYMAGPAGGSGWLTPSLQPLVTGGSSMSMAQPTPLVQTLSSARQPLMSMGSSGPQSLDWVAGPRPGGNSFGAPTCFVCCQPAFDPASDQVLYSCGNNCGWGAHPGCLGLIGQWPSQLPDSAWYCSTGCRTTALSTAMGSAFALPPHLGLSGAGPGPSGRSTGRKRSHGEHESAEPHTDGGGDSASVGISGVVSDGQRGLSLSGDAGGSGKRTVASVLGAAGTSGNHDLGGSSNVVLLPLADHSGAGTSGVGSASVPGHPSVHPSLPAELRELYLPQPSYVNDRVTLQSRQSILMALGRLLRILGYAQAVPALMQSFREAENTPQGLVQVTYHYSAVRLCLESGDLSALLAVFRDCYNVPV